ncbi:hypothetical protein NA56DRAFT_662456 [Hyaloscypha hepaticicola]|uniref:Heterokaryon incompatibility domain-containing protein n=1 Tax=Hyaloscypha hepaticicola TaxID=2082293 RepID=A0A2J6PT88_9HELO|nr:hypothetical protein NA56DRAFT_662456 [Hyaloscypha hepaticicola]
MLNITTNLCDALKRIRDLHRSKTLWADAVCINQQDLDERSHQVGLMGDIYQLAGRVVIWLGHTTPDTGLAIKLIGDIAETCCRHNSIAVTQLEGIDVLTSLTDGIPEDAVRTKDAESWKALGQFYCRPWFTRVWVIQEVLKARKAVAMCGKLEIEWLQIALTALWIRQDRHLKPRALSLGGWESFLNAAVMGNRNILRSATPLDLLRMTVQFQATDPRDKVSVASTKGLEVLSHVRHGRDIADGFPTWIPRWDRPENFDISGIGSMSFNASNGHNIREQDRVDGGTLRLGGLIFDYISKCDPIMGDKWIFGSSVNERVLAAIQAHLTNSDDSLQYPTGEDISSVYSCVLTAGLKSEFDRVWGDDDSKRHKGRFLMWLKDAIEPQINANIFTSDDKSCQNPSIFYPQTKDHENLHKGFIGIGPGALREGDFICVMYGGRVPYVLRRSLDKQKFVGECYVHVGEEGREGQMGAIYQLARHTIIYLGESTPFSSALFDLFASYRTSPGNDGSAYISNISRLSNIKAEESRNDPSRFQIDPRADVKFIAQRWPWFARVWVLQELVQSPDPWVQIGRQRVRWNIFTTCIANNQILFGFGSHCLKHLEDMDRLRNSLSSPLWRGDLQDDATVATRLFEILHDRRGLGVSDPRDMIYGHLGVLGNVKPERKVDRFFKVDYNQPIHELFMQVVLFIISARGDFDILSQVEETSIEKRTTLPTWVPDWTSPYGPISQLTFRKRPTRVKETEPPVVLIVTPPHLGLIGAFEGTIEFVLDSQPPTVDLEAIVETVLQSIENPIYITEDDINQVHVLLHAQLCTWFHEQGVAP